MPRVAFRCDASPEIGSGHIARCMALAHALRKKGAEVELISRGLPDRVRNLLIESTGAVVHGLPQPSPKQAATQDDGEPLPHTGWLPVAQKVDAEQTVELLRTGSAADWLIVDHYALDARWERDVRPHVANILVIDDLADRQHACDALLDQNFFLEAESRYAGRVPPHTELMLGPKFALLREEFAQARKQLAERDGRLRCIFVCFGGFDAAGQTLRALEAIETAALDEVAVEIVISADHPQRGQIESFCARRRAYNVHLDAANVAELMAPADLAIGASGIMNWERATLCLPSIVASVAGNQHVVARDLAADRACIYLGLAREWDSGTLGGLVRGLHGTPSLMRALASRAGQLTDGLGARRVAARLLPRPIALRRVTPADSSSIYAWRNAEETRRYSLDQKAIPLEEHRKWLERALNDPKVALLVGECDEGPVGVVRYDIDDHRALASVYLVPGRQGQGLGTAMLRTGTRWMREHYPDVMELRAAIKRDNAASLEAFSNASYRVDTHNYTLDVRHG